MTTDIKEWYARLVQSILAVNVLSFQHRFEGLPEKIPIVNIYGTKKIQGDHDWELYLNDQGQAWIITPLHYYTPGGKAIIRKASGGGTWSEKEKEKMPEDASYCVRKYRLRKYTMIEYTLNEDKLKYALCRITVVNNATSRQREDNVNAPSLSHKSMQQGGNFENATEYSDQSNLKMFFARVVQGGELSEFRKHFTKDEIMQVFSRMMDLPAASPKEHSTEAAVRNPKRHRTSTNTMEEGTSTQRQEQDKVEILGLNATKEEPEFVNSPSSLNQNNGWQTIQLSNNSGHKQIFESNSSREKGEQSSHDSKYIGTSTGSGATFEPWVPDRPEKETLGLVWPCNTHHDASYTSEGFVETKCWLNQQMVEPNAAPQEPNQLPPNFIVSSTEPMDNQNRIAPDSSTSIVATTVGWLDHQVQVQAPGPNTSNHSIIVQENNDSNNIYEGLTDLNPEDLLANCSLTSSHENLRCPIWEWENLQGIGLCSYEPAGDGLCSYEPAGDWSNM